MKSIKKAFWILVVLAVAGAGAYGWFAQSVHYAGIEAARAVKARDVKRFEKFIDLEAMGENSTRVFLDIAKEDVGKDLGPLGKILVGGLANVFGGEIAKVSGTEIAADVRKKIAAGTDLKEIGSFRPEERMLPWLDVVNKGDGFVHTAHAGTCEGEPATVVIVWMRAPSSIPLLESWRATSITRESLKATFAACSKGKKAKGKGENGKR